MQASFSMRLNKRFMIAARPMEAAWSTIRTEASSIFQSGILNVWAKRGSSLLSAALATPTTMLSPKRSTASTKPRSFTAGVHGATSKPSNLPPWNGSTGSTTADFSSPSETFPQRRPKIAFTP